jgi:hypothetical protein
MRNVYILHPICNKLGCINVHKNYKSASQFNDTLNQFTFIRTCQSIRRSPKSYVVLRNKLSYLSSFFV